MDRLGELALRYFPENNKGDTGFNAHGYWYYSKYLTDQNRKEPLSGEAYWLLLPKTILADSRSKTFSDQEAMVAAYSGSGYQLPRALEVASSLLSHYARSQERLYVDEPWTCTRCSDRDEDGNPMIVGGFSAAGFFTSISDDEDFSPSGVSCCWKFLTPGTWYSNP